MELEKGSIALPIKNASESEYYPLMLEDSKGITHYFNFDGTYDGWSSCTTKLNGSK